MFKSDSARRGCWGAVALALAVVPVGGVRAADVAITVKDLTPGFLRFWREARAEHLGPDARFALWRKLDGFAAVPPTGEGERMARELLESAWPKYPSVIGRIEQGAAGVRPSPRATLERVAALLRPARPVRMTLIVYVGALEGNAFTVGTSRGPIVAVPVEESPVDRGPTMAHEFTHAVQIAMGYSSGGWVRSIGETVLAEGLAMRVAQRLYPHRPAASFVETPTEPGWLAKARGRNAAILRDVRGALASSKSADVMRYTMGMGPAGLDREAYYVGWAVVGYWRDHGQSFAQIARIPEAAAPARVAEAIDAMLAHPSAGSGA